MKKRTLITMCITAFLFASCISLYSVGNNDNYYSDGIYYTPSTNKSVVVVNNNHDPIDESEPIIIDSRAPRTIEGYWIGGWDGSNADLKRAYQVIANYPNGFGYMTNGANVAESMAFSPDWNVFVSNGKYWWFPTSSNFELYSTFLFGPYPSADLVFFDYSPYQWRIGVTFGTYVGIGYAWGPTWYDPWYHHHYYDPWYHHHYYDPWYHHHYYDPWYHYHPYPGYYPGHHPGHRPPYRPHGPENVRPHRPNGSGHPNNGHKEYQGKWRPTTTPGGSKVITPGTTQRPSVGGGVVDNTTKPTNKNKNNKDKITRPNNNNSGRVTRPTNSNSNRVTRPTNSNSNRVTRPTNNNSSRITRPTNSSSRITRPTGGGSYRSTGGSGGGGRISRTR